MTTNINNYYKSFSGTDSLAFALFADSTPVCLGSLTTLSHSMFRNKKPVMTLGRVSVNGFTRGARMYAGTMVFTLINQNWIHELLDVLPWIDRKDDIKSDELPLFDIMIISANEYGSAIAMYIYGVEFTDEGGVISVEDMLSENTLSFIARDLDTPKALNVLGSISSSSSNITTVRSVTTNSIESTTLAVKTMSQSSNLTYNSTIKAAQIQLNKKGYVVATSGLFNNTTVTALMKFQSSQGLQITGDLDSDTLNALKDDYVKNNKSYSGIVTSADGSGVYASPTFNSMKVDTLSYNQNIDIYSKSGDWYNVGNGYVYQNSVYTYIKSPNTVPTVTLGEVSSNVQALNLALGKALGLNIVSSTFNSTTQTAINTYRNTKGLTSQTGYGSDIWEALQEDGYL